MLKVDSLSVGYGSHAVLQDVNFVVAKPTAVSGPSGSGKSTLLRILAGVQSADSGSVSLDDSMVQAPSWVNAGDSRIGLIHQDYRLVEFLTVRQNVELACEVRGLEPSRASTITALEQVGLNDEFLDRWPITLSGGEQQRVAIARALVADPRLILADEPTGALDRTNSRLVTELLLDAVKVRNTLLVVASHDPTVVDRFPATLRLESGAVTSRVGA